MNRILDLPLSVRVPACALALAAIVGVFARQAFPGVPMLIVFAWTIAAVALAGVLMIAYFVVIAGWNTWSVDHGPGADTRWLSADGETGESESLHAEAPRQAGLPH